MCYMQYETMVKAQESSLAEEGLISNGQNHSSINIVATTEYTSRVSRVRIKNRRKAYLDQNPAYFENLDLELAGPVVSRRTSRTLLIEIRSSTI